MPEDGDIGGFLQALQHVRPCKVGIAVVVREMLARMQFVETIDELVPWDPAQCRLSPGLRLLALIMAILENRRALYRLHLLYEEKDPELLLGQGVEPDALNDKAVARALDKLAAADPKRVYATVCLRAVEAYEVAVEQLHSDTTSVSVYGAYEGDEPGLGIVHGYSKDHRPDLLQFKVGCTVTHEGVPISGEILDGNKDDKRWNQELLDWLASWIAPEKREETLFVADSALITKENLERLDRHGYRFVSRLPESFEAADLARTEAVYNHTWQEVGKLASSPRTNSPEYRLAETEWEIGGRSYRLIVVHSSSLEKRRAKKFERLTEKEQRALTTAANKLGQREFSCREDAEAALAAFLEEQKPHFWDVEGHVEREWVIERGRGRPRKGEVPQGHEIYRVVVAVGRRRADVVEKEIDWNATFVLITNDWKRTALELFQAYRGQYTVEASMRWTKAPFHISPVFLKKRKRVEAFGYVTLMAYLVYALIQRAVRQALPEQDELQVEGRRTKHPTGQAVLDMLTHIAVLKVRMPEHRTYRVLLTPAEDVQRILDLLRIHADAFIQVPT
jgi:transposase